MPWTARFRRGGKPNQPFSIFIIITNRVVHALVHANNQALSQMALNQLHAYPHANLPIFLRNSKQAALPNQAKICPHMIFNFLLYFF